jgi:hypothetical protein
VKNTVQNVARLTGWNHWAERNENGEQFRWVSAVCSIFNRLTSVISDEGLPEQEFSWQITRCVTTMIKIRNYLICVDVEISSKAWNN